MIYRPGSRWHIAIAFTAAAVLHLSAVAIASLHREELVVNPTNQFTAVVADPGVESPEQPQMEIPVEMPPQPTSLPELVEPEQPVLKTRLIAPIRTARQTTMGFTADPKALALSAPRPEYPYEARSRHIIGNGIAELSIDPAPGFVEEAVMKQSTGNSILDNSAVSAFKRWRFKHGAGRKILVPIRFLLTGAE
jgi:TonB family protein